MKIAFESQARKFLADGASRKRNPLRPATLRTYKSQIEANLIPIIGKMGLQTIGNKVLSDVVTKLSGRGLSPRTITLNVTIIKKIRKSAITENGDQMFPYEWNTEVIDAPSVQDDKKATVSAQAVQDAISKAEPPQKALYALLAGTGLRIAEARAIKLIPDDGVSTVWLPKESKIIIRQQMTRTGLAATKTSAGVREVDLAPELNEFLGAPVADKLGLSKDFLLFSDCENCYRTHLEKDGIAGGFHAFRRFRVTHLKLQGVPDAIIKFWIGHAAGNITEVYTQVGGEIQSRKDWAAKAGLGFKLPDTERTQQ